ncbi:unnamed protein product [Parajaminaea phylloscopi]
MPQKFRQRGKKHKADKGAVVVDAEPAASTSSLPAHVPPGAPAAAATRGADYIPFEDGHFQTTVDPLAVRDAPSEPFVDSAPFGLVSPELKTYLKDAHTQLVRFAQSREDALSDAPVEDEFGNHEQQAQLLATAILREVDGHELSCATDNESSLALEATMEQLDNRRIRILTDRFSGNICTLACHRFGSHVVQALLRALQADLHAGPAQDVSLAANMAQSADSDRGILRTSDSLIIDVTEEIIPQAQELLQATFGTHVLRTLLSILAGNDERSGKRSKKSLLFRAKAQAGSTLGRDHHDIMPQRASLVQASAASSNSHSPFQESGLSPAFQQSLQRLREACLPENVTGQNESRALLVSPAASPTFALLLSLEAQAGQAARSGSLADIVLEGLIGEIHQDGSESKDGVEALLRHASGSHALEAVLSRLPSEYVDRFWTTYIKGKIVRIGCHPAANFVGAAAARRLSPSVLRQALEEIRDDRSSKLVKEGKTGLLLALIARASFCARSDGQDSSLERLALDACLGAFSLDAATDRKEGLIVRTLLALKTREGWQKMMRRRAEKGTGDEGLAGEPNPQQSQKRKRGEMTAGPSGLRPEEATVQGSVLLQALVRLGAPVNDICYESLLEIPDPMVYAAHPVASHVYLFAIKSPTASHTTRRRLLVHLTPYIAAFADDKYASRVADAIWSRLDGYSREKLLRDVLVHQERSLISSHYGRFFVTKRCNIALWRKDTRAWKEWESSQRQADLSSDRSAEHTVPDLADEASGGLSAAIQEDQEARESLEGVSAEVVAVLSRKDRKAQKKKQKEQKEQSREAQELQRILAVV